MLSTHLIIFGGKIHVVPYLNSLVFCQGTKRQDKHHANEVNVFFPHLIFGDDIPGAAKKMLKYSGILVKDQEAVN